MYSQMCFILSHKHRLICKIVFLICMTEYTTTSQRDFQVVNTNLHMNYQL